MNNNLILYDGAKTVDSIFCNNVVIGDDSYVNHSYLGNNVHINRRNIIDHCVIGNYSYTGPNTILKYVDIGKYCSLSWNVSSTGIYHDYNYLSVHPFPNNPSFGLVEDYINPVIKRITIGNDVWIGANACIMPGVIIADGAVVGAGSIVTNNVPAYSIVAGNPARIIKYRYASEIIDRLLEIEWWNWPEDIIRNNLKLFKDVLDENILISMELLSRSLND